MTCAAKSRKFKHNRMGLTKLRCFAFTPDFHFAFGITAPWWSNKAPQSWGLPANQYWER